MRRLHRGASGRNRSKTAIAGRGIWTKVQVECRVMARGTVRKRSKGSWELRWDEPVGGDGKRRQRSRTVQGTKRAADAELIRIESELGKTDAEKAAEMPLEECCRLFLEERAGKDLRPSSVAAYSHFSKNTC